MDQEMDDSQLDSPECIPEVFAEAWNRRDPDQLASLFDEDAEFVNVTGLWWHDRESIRRAHAYGLERIFNRSILRVLEVRVKRLSADLAVVHARMSLEGQTPVGDVEKPRTRTTIFSFVVRRTPQGWRCASAHNTDVVPGAETNVVDDEGRFRPISYRRELGRPSEKEDPMATPPGDRNPSQPPGEQGAGEMDEAEIDANVEGTFPASDPPSWTLGSDHRPAADKKRDEEDG